MSSPKRPRARVSAKRIVPAAPADRRQSLEQAVAALPRTVRQSIASYSVNTQRALRFDWYAWYGWCSDPARRADASIRPSWPIRGPALAEFIYAHSPFKRVDGVWQPDPKARPGSYRAAKTVGRYVSSLCALHRAAGRRDDLTQDEAVRTALRTIRRGRMASTQKAPLRLSKVRDILALPAISSQQIRDRAMVALAYTAMLRRSELVALEYKHIIWDTGDGSSAVRIDRSKGDQHALGQTRHVADFVAEAIRLWVTHAGITRGPLFRGLYRNGRPRPTALVASEVPVAFKRLYGRLDLGGEPCTAIAGHSARIGAAQDLLVAGAGMVGIMNAGGWTSTTMPALYTRDLSPSEGAMARMLREHHDAPTEGSKPRRAPRRREQPD
jgi:integrase